MEYINIVVFIVIVLVSLNFKYKFKNKDIKNISKTTNTVKNSNQISANNRSNHGVRIQDTGLHDNLNNDWLAKQRREESKSLALISDMFDLKVQHFNNCDAEYIRRFHDSECDAHSVDLGEKNRKRVNR